MSDQRKKKSNSKASLCASNLKVILKHRGMSVADLADDLNMSKRTLESYTTGKVSLEDARAKTVMDIAKHLGVRPEILVGMEPVDEIFKMDESLNAVSDRVLGVKRWERKRRRKLEFMSEDTIAKPAKDEGSI